MRCSTTSIALLGLFVQASTAALCTPNNATPIEQIVGNSGGSGGSGSSGGSGGSGGNSGGSGGGGRGGGGGGGGFYIPIGHVTGYLRRGVVPDAKPTHAAAVLPPRAADSVQCTAAEVCASVDDAIFCYNEQTGYFHDTEGTTGNLISGDYTLADGRRGNLYTGPTPGVETGPVTAPAAAAPTGAATTGRAATAAGAANATPTTNGASSGGFKSAMGGLVALLCAGLL